MSYLGGIWLYKHWGSFLSRKNGSEDYLGEKIYIPICVVCCEYCDIVVNS
jgi:hypothetical protein